MFHVGLYHSVLSAPCSLTGTCWERADLLVILMLFFLVFLCVLSFTHMMFQVRCGTYLYCILIISFLSSLKRYICKKKKKKKAVVHTNFLAHNEFVSHIAHVFSHEFDMHEQLLIEARSLIFGHNLDLYPIGLRVRNVG